MKRVAIERTRLPPGIIQDLLDLDCYLFPPESIDHLSNVCAKHGLPESEAMCFIEDAVVEDSVCMDSARVNIELEVMGKHHLIDEATQVLDVVGPPASGKTLFCHMLISALLEQRPADVLYLDCDGSFSPDLLTKLNCRRTECIKVVKISNWEELVSSLQLGTKFGLIVVDSIASVLRFGVRRRSLMSRILATLLNQVRSVSFLAVIVNQTTTRFVDSSEQESIRVPCLGRSYQELMIRATRISTF